MDIQREIERRFLLQEEFLGTDKPVNKTEPLVSVSVATYQHEPYIRQCLDSILMQKTNFPYEIIVGEDDSTDGTREICIEYAEKYPDKIRLFLRDRNLSHLKDENGKLIKRLNGVLGFGRMSSRGKYIALCEGDDYWTDPLKLQKQVDFFEANPTCSLVFTGCEIHKSNGEKKTIQYKINHLIDVNEYLTNSYFMTTASLLFKKEVFSEAKSEEWMSKAFAGDFILKYRALTIGTIGYVDSIAAVYNKGTEGSWSNRKLTDKVIEKEYKDNILALQYIKKHIPTLSQTAYDHKEKKLKDIVLYKQALKRGGVKGFLYLIKHFNPRRFFYFAAYIKFLITGRYVA